MRDYKMHPGNLSLKAHQMVGGPKTHPHQAGHTRMHYGETVAPHHERGYAGGHHATLPYEKGEMNSAINSVKGVHPIYTTVGDVQHVFYGAHDVKGKI